MRIVVDTTDFISALIGKQHRDKLKVVLSNTNVELFADEDLLTELAEVARRDKFRKYVTSEEVDLFLSVIKARLTLVTPTTVVTDSPDPDDNYLLSLAVDAQAEYLITGDKKHLLTLNPYRGIQIIRLQVFLNVLTGS